MARALGRHWIGIDVSSKYAGDAENRIGRKQASEVASLASGLLKMVGFGNKPGRKSFEYLREAMVIWIKGYDPDRYSQMSHDQLGSVFEGELFESREIKSEKPNAWRYFDSFLANGNITQDHLRLANTALDAYYPQRRQWNGIRKYLHSVSVIEDLLANARSRPTDLVQSIVLCEPSSFNLSNSRDHITFQGAPLQLHKHTSVSRHIERNRHLSQVSIFS